MSTGQDVVDVVRIQINDEDQDNYRWSDNELLGYINAAARQIVIFLPSANTIETIVDLGTVLVSRQTLPAGGIKFIRISNNFANDGTTREGAVRYAEKDALDSYDPDWEYDTSVADADNYFKHFCHNDVEKNVYYLFPTPSVINKFVGVVYSLTPTATTILDEDLALADEYFEAYVNYVTFRAYSKEGRFSLPSEERSALWGQFLMSIGQKPIAEESVGPKFSAPPDGD